MRNVVCGWFFLLSFSILYIVFCSLLYIHSILLLSVVSCPHIHRYSIDRSNTIPTYSTDYTCATNYKNSQQAPSDRLYHEIYEVSIERETLGIRNHNTSMIVRLILTTFLLTTTISALPPPPADEVYEVACKVVCAGDVASCNRPDSVCSALLKYVQPTWSVGTAALRRI